MTAPDQTAWPEGVIARYLTVGGATVDVTDRRTEDYLRYAADCTGCGNRWTHGDERYAREWAQAHAERCRALPQPEVTR